MPGIHYEIRTKSTKLVCIVWRCCIRAMDLFHQMLKGLLFWASKGTDKWHWRTEEIERGKVDWKGRVCKAWMKKWNYLCSVIVSFQLIDILLFHMEARGGQKVKNMVVGKGIIVNFLEILSFILLIQFANISDCTLCWQRCAATLCNLRHSICSHC